MPGLSLHLMIIIISLGTKGIFERRVFFPILSLTAAQRTQRQRKDGRLQRITRMYTNEYIRLN